MALTEYIKEHHKGDRTAFAKSQGVGLTQVNRWLKMGAVMIDGEVWRKVSKQAKTSKP
jgi:hypothetical protein